MRESREQGVADVHFFDYFDIPYYGSSEQEKVSCAFKHLVQNLKAYNGVEI